MTDYPRTRNSWVDSSEGLLSNRGKILRCPNCNSSQYTETVSLEHCPSCNYRVDYWGGGSNEVADRYAKRREREERDREVEFQRELQEEHEAQFNHWDHEYNGY